jgi:hypothetical protein
MRSSKPLPQARPGLPRRPQTPTGPQVVARQSAFDPAAQLPDNVKYVNLSVDVPAGSPFEPDSFVRYFNPQPKSPGSNWKGSSFQVDSSFSSRASSPFGFVPIEEGRQQRFVSPCPSPYDFRKSNQSPSMMSVVTESTVETCGTTFDSRMSPSIMSMSPTPFYRPTPRGSYASSTSSSSSNLHSPRPKTPTNNGRKSPFAKAADDDSVRKTRIKTELCMHYENGRPCPFGSNCTYAHGEEELQMTKLLDLDAAGLVDVETFRTKPCFSWVMTGSWYVLLVVGRFPSVLFDQTPLTSLDSRPFYSLLTVLSVSAAPASTTLVWKERSPLGCRTRKRKAIVRRRILTSTHCTSDGPTRSSTARHLATSFVWRATGLRSSTKLSAISSMTRKGGRRISESSTRSSSCR